MAAVNLNFEIFNNVIRANWKYFRKNYRSKIYAEFSPLFTGAYWALILSIAGLKFNFDIFKMSFAQTGSTFEKNITQVEHEICRNKSSIHWRKRSINIAYSSGEINFDILMTSFAHTGSTIEKVVSYKISGMR